MKIYFAPLEGITGYLFRTTYDRHFGGITRYYSPFVTTRDGGFMKTKEKRDILPQNNCGLNLVPQILTNRAEDFCQTALHMQEMGYDEVNLNLGCPSGTVTSKNRGAGFLRNPDELSKFLDYIFSNCPLSISIKSRIGFYEQDEFFHLLDIYNQYPIKELTLHPRTKEDLYSGKIHMEMFSYAVEHSKNPLCYNGDLCTLQDIENLLKQYPSLQSIMIGRGFLKHPGFIKDYDYNTKNGTTSEPTIIDQKAYLHQLFAFMTDLRETYASNFSGDTPVLFKMKELWSYLKESVPDGEAWFKKIKRTKNLPDYDTLLQYILLR